MAEHSDLPFHELWTMLLYFVKAHTVLLENELQRN